MPQNTVEQAFNADVARIVDQKTEMTDEEFKSAMESAGTFGMYMARLLTFGVPINQLRVEKSIDTASIDSDED